MRMIPNSPFLVSENGERIVGFKNPDDTDSYVSQQFSSMADFIAAGGAEANPGLVMIGDLILFDGVIVGGSVNEMADIPIGYTGSLIVNNYGLGGSRWHNNGTGWRPDGNVILQQSLSDISCDGGTATYTMTVSPRIPAGVLLPGSKLSMKMRGTKTGVAALLDYKFLLSINSDGSGGVLCSNTIRIGAPNTAFASELDLVIRGETEIQQIQNQLTSTTPYGGVTTSQLAQRFTGLPNVSSHDVYLVLARLAKTGADVGTLHYYEVVLS